MHLFRRVYGCKHQILSNLYYNPTESLIVRGVLQSEKKILGGIRVSAARDRISLSSAVSAIEPNTKRE